MYLAKYTKTSQYDKRAIDTPGINAKYAIPEMDREVRHQSPFGFFF
jgi:hypothetical protein